MGLNGLKSVTNSWKQEQNNYLGIMWARLSPRVLASRVAFMEISIEVGTGLANNEGPLVCKLSDSPFRILWVSIHNVLILLLFIAAYTLYTTGLKL